MLYWSAWWPSVLSQADFENMYDGTKDPCLDFVRPGFYNDCSTNPKLATLDPLIGSTLINEFNPAVLDYNCVLKLGDSFQGNEFNVFSGKEGFSCNPHQFRVGVNRPKRKRLPFGDNFKLRG
jgi:hypothetical protein